MKSDTLATIAIYFMQMHDYAKAYEIINIIPYTPSKFLPLYRLAISHIDEKNYDTAISVMNEIESGFFREEVLKYLLMAYLQTNKNKEAFAIVLLARQESSQARLYSFLAQQYWENKRYEEALQAVDLISDQLITIKTLFFIAKNIQSDTSIPTGIKEIFCGKLTKLQ
jgi:predicted Zn-dependent protease